MTYQCIKCKYKVPEKDGKAPRRCPYCGKEGSLVREVSASEIVRDVDEII